MFLIRAAFWLSVAVMFIPADPQSGTDAPRVTALQALVAARAAVADLSGFCDRNPDVCVTGNAAFEVFTEKAQKGARLLYRYLGEDGDKPAAGQKDGTLTDEDRTPVWHAPGAGKSA
jgi:hypothetical protein